MQLSYRGIRYTLTNVNTEANAKTIDTARQPPSTQTIRYRGTSYSPDRYSPLGVSFDCHLRFLGATYSRNFFY